MNSRRARHVGKLQGQVALVTGASSGIGQVTALLLASEGAQVWAAARRSDALAAVAAEGRRRGFRIEPLALDVTDGNSLASAAREVHTGTNGYGIDILVNNAGYGQLGPIEEVPIAKLRQQLETNLIGAVALTQLFLAPMRRRRYGRIINVSSIAGRIGTPYFGAYAASKFGLEAISDALRWEVRPWNVRVALIEPGPIATAFGAVVEQQQQPPSDRPTAYPLAYRLIRSFNESTQRAGLPPEIVARTILRAAASPRPAARYVVPGYAAPLVALVRLLPSWLLDPAIGLSLRAAERNTGEPRALPEGVGG
jgi:NAD(P)-dependent dehydrogenase (short-subunit alcohol dehydrogenase family)